MWNHDRKVGENYDVFRFYRVLVVDICLQPKVIGTCQERRPTWFFDIIEKECKLFQYSGKIYFDQMIYTLGTIFTSYGSSLTNL